MPTETTGTNYPVAGNDGHAYLCLWVDGRHIWYSDRTVAFSTNADQIIQRCMSGRNKGSEWTVRDIPYVQKRG